MSPKKQKILEYCQQVKRPVTAKEILMDRFPDKSQPYINSDINELVSNRELIRNDDDSPYTVRIPKADEVFPPLKDYSRKKSNPMGNKSASQKINDNAYLPINLKNSFNEFWSNYFHNGQDYYEALTFSDLVKLKMIVGKINNLITYELTLLASHQIAVILKLTDVQKIALEHQIQTTDVNANGYDIEFTEEPKFICEIKGTIPSGGKKRFGAAQEREIRKDITGLLEGKTKWSLPSEESKNYYKFMCFYNDSNNSIDAVHNLVNKLNNEYENIIEIWHEQEILDLEKIYVLMLASTEKSL